MTGDSDFEADAVRFLNLSHDLICVAGMDGYMKYVNPACEAKLGYTEAELLAVPFLDLIHPEDKAKTTAEVERLSTGIQTLDFENRYITKADEILYLEWSASPHSEEELMYCIGRDITDRRIAEEAIQVIAVGDDDTLWLGTGRGLIHVRKEGVERFYRNASIELLDRDSLGILWFRIFIAAGPPLTGTAANDSSGIRKMKTTNMKTTLRSIRRSRYTGRIEYNGNPFP